MTLEEIKRRYDDEGYITDDDADDVMLWLIHQIEQEKKNCAALDRHYESYMKERVLIIAERDGIRDELYSWIEENKRLQAQLAKAQPILEAAIAYTNIDEKEDMQLRLRLSMRARNNIYKAIRKYEEE